MVDCELTYFGVRRLEIHLVKWETKGGEYPMQA